MNDINALVSIACGLITIFATVGTIFNLIAKVEKKIQKLQFHIESHCVTINHISDYLSETTNYQAITKK